MPVGHRTATISSIVPFASDQYGVELHTFDGNSNNHSSGSNKSSSDAKPNSITKRFQKIVGKFDFLKVEKRGIDRILPEDRTDSAIINTAMIWVRNQF